MAKKQNYNQDCKRGIPMVEGPDGMSYADHLRKKGYKVSKYCHPDGTIRKSPSIYDMK